MQKKSLDEKKILMVLLCKNKEEVQSQLQLVERSKLFMPNAWTVNVTPVIKNKSLAATINSVQKNSDAKYKIYINAPAIWLDRTIIVNTVNAFFVLPKTAMIGLFGSEMPVDGNYVEAKTMYGVHAYRDTDGHVKHVFAKDALYFQSTRMLDNSYFATNEDLVWDEKIGENFAVAAQCCNFRSKGYEIGVPYQENPWIIFAQDSRSYSLRADDENYKKQLEQFQTLYYKKYLPLVSVLIPTYNQPKFFKEALEGVLNQTYRNIEIVVGDDSTNNDVKNVIKPYLKKYQNIKYFNHGGPLGKGGNHNTFFLANHCSGEYINYLWHDDLFYPTKISRMMEYYVRDLENEIRLVTSARNLIDENTNVIRRKNPWQPHTDMVMSSEKVGRMILFTIANFLGEPTTVLIKKSSLLLKDAKTGKEVYDCGIFCGVQDIAYWDLGGWLNILKTGGKCVFISEVLSAFRQHSAQNTFDMAVRSKIPLDALTFMTISWLNNIFFHNVEEYKNCCQKWIIMSQMWYKPVEESDLERTKIAKRWIEKFQKVCKTGDYDKIMDATITYLLTYLGDNNAILPLVRKNERTGLWEKANDGIMLRGERDMDFKVYSSKFDYVDRYKAD